MNEADNIGRAEAASNLYEERLAGWNASYDRLMSQISALELDKLNTETVGLEELSDKLNQINNIMSEAYEIIDEADRRVTWGSNGINPEPARLVARDGYNELRDRYKTIYGISKDYARLKDAESDKIIIRKLLEDYVKTTEEEMKASNGIITELEESIKAKREKLAVSVSDAEKEWLQSTIDADEKYMKHLVDSRKPLEDERALYLAEIEKVDKGGELSFVLDKSVIHGKYSYDLKKKNSAAPVKSDSPKLSNPTAGELDKGKDGIPVEPHPDKLDDKLAGMDKDMGGKPKTEEPKPADPKAEDKKEPDKKPVKTTSEDDVPERGRVVKTGVAKNVLLKAVTFIIAAVVGFLGAHLHTKISAKLADKAEKLNPTTKPSDTETTIETAVEPTPEVTPSIEDAPTPAEPVPGGEPTMDTTPSPTSTPAPASSVTPTPSATPRATERTILGEGDVHIDEKTNADGSKTIVSKEQGNTVTYRQDSNGNITGVSTEKDKDATKVSINGKEYTDTTVPNANDAKAPETKGQSYEDYAKSASPEEAANALDALMNGDPTADQVFDGMDKALGLTNH